MGVPREKLRSEITEVLPGMHYKLIYYRTVKKKRISNICQINIKKNLHSNFWCVNMREA